MSVPQIVVRVMRMTASRAPACGRATSSTRMSAGPWNTFARIIAFDLPIAGLFAGCSRIAFIELNLSKLKFRFAQLTQDGFQLVCCNRFCQTGSCPVGIGERDAVARITGSDDDDRQIVTTFAKRAEQRDRVTIAAVNNGEIKLGGPTATNFQCAIDVVPDQNFAAKLLERFGHGLFKSRIAGEQESESNVHCVPPS